MEAGTKVNKVISLSDDADAVSKKVMTMFTDPNRLTGREPGNVENNPVFTYHDAFNPDRQEVEELKTRYRAGRVGDVEVKQRLVSALNAFLANCQRTSCAFRRTT